MQLFPVRRHHASRFVDQYNEDSRARSWRRCAISSCCTITPPNATTRRSGAIAGDMFIPDVPRAPHRAVPEGAHAWQDEGELFRVDSWAQVMLGQGIAPERYHHYAQAMSDQDLTRFLSGLKGSIEQAVAQMPSHQDFLNRYCKASNTARPELRGLRDPGNPS